MGRTTAVIATTLGLSVLLVGSVRGAPATEEADCAVARSERFAFYSDSWVNLHHFLFQWARSATPAAPRDRRRPVEVGEAGEAVNLAEEEQETWSGALAFYAENLVPRDLLFTRELVDLKGRLTALPCGAPGPRSVEPELGAILEAAWPVYQEHWWPAHDAANRAWIESQVPLLASYETGLALRLAQAYGGQWPEEHIRVDVSVYANWAGAYTTNDPNHVTLSGVSYPGLEGLELLFHEVSHASVFEQPLLGHIAAAFRREGTERPDRLGHVLQFVTPAEILRLLLTEEGRDDVRFIADAMAERRRSRGHYQVVLEHWRPFLAGESSREEALDRIARAFGP